MGLRTFFGRPGQWFEENDLDGDKNSIFHDVDGSVTGYVDTYVGRADNYLIQHPGCVSMPQWSGVICSGRYSQVQHVQVHASIVLVCPPGVKHALPLTLALLFFLRCTSRHRELPASVYPSAGMNILLLLWCWGGLTARGRHLSSTSLFWWWARATHCTGVDLPPERLSSRSLTSISESQVCTCDERRCIAVMFCKQRHILLWRKA